MKTEVIRKLGRATIIFNLILIAVSSLYFVFAEYQLEPEDQIFALSLLVFSGIYFPLAWLIISRSPRNIIGWLFTASITSFSLQTFGTFLRDGIGIQSTFVLLSGNLWLFGLLIPISVMLLYFPDGQLLSHRWRLVLFADVLGILVLYMSFTIGDLTIVANYAWFEGATRILPPLQISILFGLFGSLLSVILRYRRSKGIVRAQIKWVAFMAAVSISILLLSLSTGLVEEGFGLILFFSPPILIALAIGLAILRFRLYDIDIIIRRTIQYTLLTGLLAFIYFGLVVSLQNIYASFSSQQSPIIIVISTLVIAALFNPLRIRIQNFIDRRFFRKKYDAEQTLVRFSTVTRDEVNIKKITHSLLNSVEETMQPEMASLWLVSAANRAARLTSKDKE
jgi:hypothetical protein